MTTTGSTISLKNSNNLLSQAVPPVTDSKHNSAEINNNKQFLVSGISSPSLGVAAIAAAVVNQRRISGPETYNYYCNEILTTEKCGNRYSKQQNMRARLVRQQKRFPSMCVGVVGGSGGGGVGGGGRHHYHQIKESSSNSNLTNAQIFLNHQPSMLKSCSEPAFKVIQFFLNIFYRSNS